MIDVAFGKSRTILLFLPPYFFVLRHWPSPMIASPKPGSHWPVVSVWLFLSTKKGALVKSTHFLLMPLLSSPLGNT